MLRTLLAQALTSRGEVEAEVAEASLAPLDRSWYETLAAHADTVDVVDPAGGEVTHLVAVDRHSARPRVLAGPVAPPGHAPVLHLRAGPALTPAQARRYAALIAREADGLARTRAWLAGLAPAEIDARLHALRRVLAHAGPVILFVGEQTFTNIYDPPNLSGGAVRPGSPRCTLSGLAGDTVAGWPDASVHLFYALTTVASIGPSRLLKELNFLQVGYWQVRSHLVARHAYWAGVRAGAAADRPAGDDVPTGDLVAALRTTRQQAIDAPGGLVYRAVNGRTFRKVEQRLGSDVHRPRGREYHKQVADAEPSRRPAVAVALLRELLAKALVNTGADYAMSRGVRDYAAFTDLCAAGDYDSLQRWEPDRFFCFVLERVRSAEGPAILRSISERMKYNTWHFLPDTLRTVGADPLAARDYFFAPGLPDVSVHEDRVHAGHIRAGIRFALRTPRPVTVRGVPLNGLADLRFARTAQPRFQPADLAAIQPIADDILQVHQALADFRITIPLTESDYDRYVD
ncbi:hypothetical protein ABZ436_22715 [Micromonospora matsumotoense]|uniref:hypothetical protein n=1 Tax=Micromonospora matsumotoense TaxID=121616 RepID=UPI0033C6648B